MGGIAIARGPAAAQLVSKMLDKLSHRGGGLPRVVTHGEWAFGEFAKPGTGDEKAQAVVDGRIFVKERGVLEGAQLHEAFREAGTGILRELNGGFAFALAGDRPLIARDRYGLKPLYYAGAPGGLLFASEIKALVDLSEEISVFPPGHYYIPGQGFCRYAQIQVKGRGAVDPLEAARSVKTLLAAAVHRRLRDMDPSRIGVYLSGGIDSSAVAAEVARLKKGVPSFAVGIPEGDDLGNGRAVARALGMVHHEHVLTEAELLEVLPLTIYHLESFDAPLVRSSVANFIVARNAREAGITHVLCGEGGDELFAGYHYLKGFDPGKCEAELKELLATGHSGGFQRVDRVNAAHGLDAEMPFMDLELAGYACSLPLGLKIYGKSRIEKWVLRKAYEDSLPDEVVWREKQKFYEGSGSVHVMQRLAGERITDREFRKEREPAGGVVLSSKEELFYYRIFKRYFPHRSILDTVGKTRTLGNASSGGNRI